MSWAMYLTAKYLWKNSPNKLRGKSTTPTTSKQELFVTLVTTVNYCHKEIYYRHCRGPRYASETSYYKKFENEEDNVKSNKNLVKQFSGGRAFFLWAYFRGIIFWGAVFSGAFSLGAFFPGAFFRTTCTIYDIIIYWLHFTIKGIPVKHVPPKSISTGHLSNSEVDLGLLPEPRWSFLFEAFNGFKRLTIIIKCFTLDVAAVLDPPLLLNLK